MALTPVADALNRATPGFDALVGALQSTTDRIVANQQFAKEVQARKDFALFQADLQIESEVELFKKLSPLKIKEREEQHTVDIQADLDRAGQMIPIEVNRFQKLETAKEPFDETARAKDKEDTFEIMEKEQEYALERIEAQNRNRESGVSALEIKDAIISDIRQNYPRASEEYTAISPTQLEDGGYAPVTVRVDGNEIAMSYEDYTAFMSNEERRLSLIEQLERERKDTDTLVSGITPEDETLGLDEINDAIVELRNSKMYSIPSANKRAELVDVLTKYGRATVARLTPAEITDIREFNQVFDQLSAEGIPQQTMINIDSGRVQRLNERSPKEAIEYIQKNLISIDQISDLMDEEDSRVRDMVELYRKTDAEVLPYTTGLVMNWGFVSRKNQNYKDAFLTREEAALKLYNEIIDADPVNQLNNQRNPNNPVFRLSNTPGLNSL